jgi:SAM-dependent methyltransferase
MRSTDATYLLDNAGGDAPERLAALSSMFDPGTKRHLMDRGVTDGWHCLEVGGGGGSIATWLADRVGPTGTVVATDIDPRFLERLAKPRLEVRRHDVAKDPLPEAAFDLIHARLVLNSLLGWEHALEKLVLALKPGGWLLDEEFDSQSLPPDPAESPGETLLRTHVAMGRLMTDHGFDRRFGRRLFGRLRRHGLTEVGAEARMLMVQGGSPGASLVRANYRQLRGALVEAGYVTEPDVDRDLARLDDPEFMMPSSILWAAWGRRPTSL